MPDNPGPMAFLGVPRATDPPDTARPIGVSELNRRAATLLEDAFPRVYVEGVMSRPVMAASGHLYFGLQDDGPARIDGVMWAGRARGLKFKPAEGQLVRARGKLTVYAASGKYQLVVDELEPAGEGAREKRLRLLREKLAAEGLFDPARKRSLPFLPRTIALVTSPTGAAVRDLLRVILRRFPEAGLLVVPVRVQGDGAAEEIADGIRRAARRPDVDVLIVGRGGGSIEDLWAFNEEVVARAVFGSRVPVVSAVGHEIDTTVCDAVADLRCATPSEAGERTVPVHAELTVLLGEHEGRLSAGVRRAARTARQALDASLRRRGLAGFGRIVEDRRQGLDELAERMDEALTLRRSDARRSLSSFGRLLDARRPDVLLAAARAAATDAGSRLSRAVKPPLEAGRSRLANAGRALAALDPTAVLSRGFSLTWAEAADGSRRLLRSAAGLRPGETLRSTLGRGPDVLSTPTGVADPVVVRPDPAG